ncbi:MAG: PEP-CTERM sorting domain-containing protein [Armatimonadetes bacterium]|nr:PEP-CTERM sorting domain-containing protein [Armatimonadota bacterium]
MRVSQFFTAGAVSILVASSASAQIITQWNFNSGADASAATGTTAPSIDLVTGTPSLGLVGGTTNPSFNSGVGSSDPEATDDSGWQITTWAAQGVENLQRGIQINVNTTGFENITFSFDQRHSNSVSRYFGVQYTTDGTNYITLPGSLLTPGTVVSSGTADTATVVGNLFSGDGGDVFFNGRGGNLAGISGVNNNPNFAIRILSSFDPTTGNSYTVSDNDPAISAYATTGTARFDMITVNGTAAVVVPEANTLGLLALALPIIGGVIARRRK